MFYANGLSILGYELYIQPAFDTYNYLSENDNRFTYSVAIGLAYEASSRRVDKAAELIEYSKNSTKKLNGYLRRKFLKLILYM